MPWPYSVSMYAAFEVLGALLLEESDRGTRPSAYYDSCCDMFWSAVNVSRARLGFGSEPLAGHLCLTRSKRASQLCGRLSST